MHNPTTWFLAVLAAVQIAQAAPQGISGTARCGPSFGLTCKGSAFGSCCSQYSYCGSTDAYCSSGCQSGWGTCNSDPAPSVTPSVTTPNLKVSNNGKCAQKTNGRTCLGSEYGNCCSQYGYCGSTLAYCGQGCNPLFGTCTSSQSSSAAMVPSVSRSSSASSSRSSSVSASASASPSSANVSKNARCGHLYGASPAGQTCKGSTYGDCCSQYSYCGITEEYCGKGCQPGFGNCNALPSSSSNAVSLSSTSALSSSVASSTSASGSSSSTQAFSSVSSSASSSSTVASSSLSSIVSSSSEIASTSTVSSSVISSAASSVDLSSSVASSTAVSSSPSPSTCTPQGRCNVQALPNTLTRRAYTIIQSTTFEHCSQLCADDAQCQFLIFLAGQACHLYDFALSNDATLTPQTSLRLYERSCLTSCLASSLSVVSSSVVVSTATSSVLVSSSSLALSIVSSSTPVPSSCPTGRCDLNVFPIVPGTTFTQYRLLTSVPIEECTTACSEDAQCQWLAFRGIDRWCFLYNMAIPTDATMVTRSNERLFERSCLANTCASSTSSPSSIASFSTTVSSSPIASSSAATSVTSMSVSSSIQSLSVVSSSALPSSTGRSICPTGTCGIRSYPESAQGLWNLKINLNFEQCTKLCLDDRQCQFFFHDNDKQCYVYYRAFSDVTKLTPRDTARLYERSCFSPCQGSIPPASIASPSATVIPTSQSSTSPGSSVCPVGICNSMMAPLGAGNDGAFEVMRNTNFEECAQACLADARCQSFLNYGDKDCSLIGITLNSGAEMRSAPQYSFNERSCFDPCPVSSPSASIASSSKIVSSTLESSSPSASSSFVASSTAIAATPVPSTCSGVATGACNVARIPVSVAGSLTSSRDLHIAQMSFDQCAQLCLDRDQCQFFFYAHNMECFLWKVPLSTVTTQPEVGERLYERSCFPCGLPSSSASSMLSISSSVTPSSSAAPSSTAPSSTESYYAASFSSFTMVHTVVASLSIAPSISSTTTTSSIAIIPSQTSSPSAPTCGRQGLPFRALPNRAYLRPAGTLPFCTNLCRSDARCTYFLMINGHQCYLFDLVYNKDETWVQNSGVVFYERTCGLE